jgi:hypothetical protein
VTFEVGLSTELYKIIIEQMSKYKKTMSVESKHLSDFLTNFIDMKEVNS